MQAQQSIAPYKALDSSFIADGLQLCVPVISSSTRPESRGVCLLCNRLYSATAKSSWFLLMAAESCDVMLTGAGEDGAAGCEDLSAFKATLTVNGPAVA